MKIFNVSGELLLEVEGVNLQRSDLQFANLTGANLKGENLEGTEEQ